MNPERFFLPRYMGMRNSLVSNPGLGLINNMPRKMGLFSKITSGIRSVNWGGLLNNANKTLNVVNQAIPLVRQAGPMVNNMKSMLKIAKVFGNETTNRSTETNIKTNVVSGNSDVVLNDNQNFTKKKEVLDDNQPNFFV